MMGWGRRVGADHGRKKWKVDMHAEKVQRSRWRYGIKSSEDASIDVVFAFLHRPC